MHYLCSSCWATECEFTDLAGALQAAKQDAAEVLALKTNAGEAEKRLQACRASKRQGQERLEAAAAEAQKLGQERLNVSKELEACSAASRAGKKRLAGLQQDAATEKEVTTLPPDPPSPPPATRL